MYKVIQLLLYATSVLCQYSLNTGMKADVTFNDYNERFDLSNLIRQQDKYRTNAFDRQSSEEYRRYIGDQNIPDFRRKGRKHKNLKKVKRVGRSKKSLLKDIKKQREAQLNRILNDALLRIHSTRRNGDFAYHDTMDSDGENIEDFNLNLENFKATVKENSGRLDDVVNVLSDIKHSRRDLPVADEDILMHYAFPVNMRVEGYLQTALE